MGTSAPLTRDSLQRRIKMDLPFDYPNDANDENEALNDANKGLVVFFIISIFIINCLLILKTVIRRGFMYNAKSLTIISLAIGDIFLALFPLVVQARFFYESDTFVPSGNTYTAVQVYMFYLIHFVYGVGMIVLAVELVYQYKGRPSAGKSMDNMVKAVIFSAVPWIFGLIIVLPITMGCTLSSTCELYLEPSRQKAMHGVSVLLPASMTLIVCIVVMCIRLEPTLFTFQAANYQDTTPGMVIATHNMMNGPQQYHMTGVVGKRAPTASPDTCYNQIDNQKPTLGGPDVIAPSTQFLPPQYPVHQQTGQSNLVITAPVYAIQPQNRTSPNIPDPGREKKVLLIVAILYFICVVPQAAYSISKTDDLSNALPGATYTTVIASLTWLSVFRSVITPVVWMACSRN